MRTGKKQINYPPYQVFEAMDLDEMGKYMKRNKDAFLACQALYRWNSKTDFFKPKEYEASE